jgi:hypothetical protein
MLKRALLFLLFDIIFGVIVVGKTATPWGFWGHRHINYYAVFCLPEEMLPLFKTNVDYLTRHAVDADQRRYLLPEEAARHYIDLDYYENEAGEIVLPQHWKTACDSFSVDTLNAHGIVPFQVYWSFLHLQKMFEVHDANGVLKAAADLGHYVGDAHVPLHTTSNYNGQKTGQKGIHAFWESRIPELSGERYLNFVPKVDYIDDPQSFIWEAVMESHRLLDSVLRMEHALRERLGEEQMYTIAMKGQSLQRVISPAFAQAYEEAMNGMVERRYRSAIHALSSLWYTAWVNAGQPILPFEKVRPLADTVLLTQDSSLVLPGHAE